MDQLPAMATPFRQTRSHVEARASSRQLPALADDLLLEIFLRIACPADLTRASAACIAFHRLITDPTFLVHYHNYHKPLLLGVLNLQASKGFHPIEAPQENTPAARALGNISFDYLPRHKRDKLNSWFTRDVRDGRILFDCSDLYNEPFRPCFAVCDPLLQRYLMLPPIPHHGQEEDFKDFDALFVPCADEDDETSFRVMGEMHYGKKLVVSVFDSSSGNWNVGTSSSWEALISLTNAQAQEYPVLLRPTHADGCLYWKVYKENKLIKLDISRMELSTVDLPPDHKDVQDLLVVGAEKRRLGMFSCSPDGKFMNYYNSMQSEDQRASKWQLKNTTPLPAHDKLLVFGGPQGYIFLQAKVQGSTICYSLDNDNLRFERVTQMTSDYFHCYPYFGSRPSMSLKRI